jgi:hypothetical protein
MLPVLQHGFHQPLICLSNVIQQRKLRHNQNWRQNARHCSAYGQNTGFPESKGSKRMIRFAIAMGGLALVGCSTPDVSPGIGEAVALLAETDRQVRPTLESIAAIELADAEDAAMRDGAQVIGFDGDCDPVAAREQGQVFSQCRLIERAAPVTVAVNATQVILAIDTLGSYYAALLALAESDAPDEVAARSAALIDTLAAFDSENGTDAFATLAARKDPISRSAGFWVNQARIAALRKVMRRADPVIEELTETAVAWLDGQPGNVLVAYQAFLGTRTELVLATEAGDLGAQRRATEALRASHAALLQSEQQSPANHLLLLRKLHGDLLSRLSSPQSAGEFITTLEEIKAISDLVRKGE